MAANMQDNTFDNCECVCSKIDDICLALASEQNDTCFPHVVPSNAVAESFGTSQCNCCKCLKCPISVIKRLCQLAMRDDERQYTACERYSVFEGGLSMGMDKKPQLDDRRVRATSVGSNTASDLVHPKRHLQYTLPAAGQGRGDFAYIKKSKKLDYSSDERKLKPRRSSTKGKSKQVKGSDTDSDFIQENRKRRRRSKPDNKQQVKAIQNGTKPKSYTVSKVKKHGSAQKPFFASSSSSNVAFKTNRISANRRKRVGKSGSELDAGRAMGAESQKSTKESKKASGKERELNDIAQVRMKGRNKSSNEVNRKLKKKKQKVDEIKDTALTTQIGTEVLKEVVQLDQLAKSRKENKIRKMKKAFDVESFRWTISEIDEKTNDGNDDEAQETKNPPLWVELKETTQDQKQEGATEKLELSKVKVKGGEKSGERPRTTKAETKKHQADIIKKKKKAEKERIWPVVDPRIGIIKEMNKRISRGMYATIVSNDMFGGGAQNKSSDTWGKKLKILNRLTPDYLKWERIEQSTDYEKNRQKRLSEKQKPRIRKFNDADDNYKKGAIRRPRKAKYDQKSTRVEQMGISDFMRAKLEAGDMRRLRTISERTVQKNPSTEFHPSLSTPSAPNRVSEFGDVSNPYPAAINPLSYCFM